MVQTMVANTDSVAKETAPSFASGCPQAGVWDSTKKVDRFSNLTSHSLMELAVLKLNIVSFRFILSLPKKEHLTEGHGGG